jgi:ubiquinone/menaquinone biosynthesis C-methylase UbiE
LKKAEWQSKSQKNCFDLNCINNKMSEWKGYILDDFQMSFDPGMLVLDVGCGLGEQMQVLTQQGCSVIGLDLDLDSLSRCQSMGLAVLAARAEQMPLASGTFDGIICKVVLPYTYEDQVIREISRLLKPEARCYLISHGAGYYLRYLLWSSSWKYRLYGLRTLLTTWIWVLTNKRLPGFLGDTIYQSRRRLAKYYQENGLRLLKDTPSKTFGGLAVFSQHLIEKTDTRSRRQGLAEGIAKKSDG